MARKAYRCKTALRYTVCVARDSPLRVSSVIRIARHLIGVRLNILTSKCNQLSSPPTLHHSTTRGEEVARVRRSGGTCIGKCCIKGPEALSRPSHQIFINLVSVTAFCFSKFKNCILNLKLFLIKVN